SAPTPPPIGYPPHQPPGYPAQARSNTGLIVTIVLVIVALLVGAGIVVAKIGFSDSASPLDTSPKTPAGPSDADKLAKAFPELLPQGVDTKYD
ncbi:hypothetical protein IU505_35565, partial [Nocardia nova]|nr:hypothetical protein [Nocardia nova]